MPKDQENIVLPLVEKMDVQKVVQIVNGMRVEQEPPVAHSSILPYTIVVEVS